MLRFARPRQTIMSTARLPMRYETMRQNAQIQNVQRVRFQKPGFRWKPFVISCAALYISFNIYTKMVLDPLARSLDDMDESELPDLPDDEGDEEDGSFFIPFPGTTKQLEPKPYRGSDPEWQEYIKFSQDQDLAKRVREELANFVKVVAEKHPMLAARCGKGQMKLRRYWLDVDFPTHPPPEFERTGLEINPEFVAVSTMPVDSSTVFRIRNTLWPSPIMKSFWSFTKVLAVDRIKSIARYFGVQVESSPTTIEQILAKHAEITRLPKRDPKDGPSALPPAMQSPTAMQNSGRATIPKLPEEKSGSEDKGSLVPLQEHLKRPVMAFKSMLAKTWRPAKNYPPRGSILVTGFVEVDSPRAWLVFDVKAAWDPKTKTYDPRSMVLSLRRLQMKKQGPLGGA